MNALLITNLFPNNKEPNRAVFVKQSVVHLAKMCHVVVVAPVNWFPRWLKWPKSHAISASIVREEVIEGVRVLHPRWFSIPVLTRLLNGILLFSGLLPGIRKLSRQFMCDIIYAHWLYPDGFASTILSIVMRKPLVLHAHGCDLNLYGRYFFRRLMIRWSMNRARTVIVVSKPMYKKAVELGIPESKIVVIRNGVDKKYFYPMDQDKCRRALNLSLNEKIILFIGSFEEVKGIQFLLPAIRIVVSEAQVPVRLVMIGKGSLRDNIVQTLAECDISEHVTLAGEVKHDAIVQWLNASDILCLPSIREGLPNVVLEAQACGKPVVTSRVGGIPDVIIGDEYGFLVEAGNVTQLSGALQCALAKQWDSVHIMKNPNLVSWEENAVETFEVLQKAISKK